MSLAARRRRGITVRMTDNEWRTLTAEAEQADTTVSALLMRPWRTEVKHGRGKKQT